MNNRQLEIENTNIPVYYDIDGKIAQLEEGCVEDRLEFIGDIINYEHNQNILITVLEKLLKKMGLMGIVPNYRVRASGQPVSLDIQDMDVHSRIDQEVLELSSKSENTKATFFHRFIYNEDDAYVLREIAVVVIARLVEMNMLSTSFELSIDEDAYMNAITQYDNGNKKFYTKRHTEAGT